jgi:hypothetical protein
LPVVRGEVANPQSFGFDGEGWHALHSSDRYVA